MKVFFAGSSANLVDSKDVFKLIMRVIGDGGHETISLYDYLGMTLEDIFAKDEDDLRVFYCKWQKIASEIDVAVVEASMPGTVNLGVLIGALVERGIPTVCVCRKGRKPILVDDLLCSKLIWVEYEKNSDVEGLVRWGLEEAERWLERRFTFIISGKIDTYLEKVVKTSGLSKSEFIRKLIEDKIDEG